MDETVVIVTGAEPLAADTIEAIPDDAIIIAADGGLDHALAAGLRPAGLVGDLDSLSTEALAWAEEHATIQRHTPDKDQTDTELALAFASTFQPDRLILASGGGDRLDHTMAAIGALGHPTLTSIPEIEGWWAGEHIRVLHGPGRLALDLPVGATISLLASHGPCTGVTVTGTTWQLDHDDLAPMVGRGISNITTDRGVEISLSTGVLTIFVDPEGSS